MMVMMMMSTGLKVQQPGSKYINMDFNEFDLKLNNFLSRFPMSSKNMRFFPELLGISNMHTTASNCRTLLIKNLVSQEFYVYNSRGGSQPTLNVLHLFFYF